jgi:hypothetical protein
LQNVVDEWFMFADATPAFGFWRKVMLELHGIDLPERQ